jgi:MDMPI C-terminal domain
MPDTARELSYIDLLAILGRSHDRLVATLSPLGIADLGKQSYDDDWSIAQVERVAQGVAEPARISLTTTAPERRFLLVLTTEGGELTRDQADGDGATGRISLPAEAFVRLVYGRLDRDHTPQSVSTEGIDLHTLRGAFPGV